jgi:SAM-dependent methyltransferase
MSDLPLPPEELIRRAGYTPGGDLTAAYLAGGAANRQLVLSLLPDGWSTEGRRILDFGCGAGKVLHHFAPDAARAELWGCDTDAASVAWIERTCARRFGCFATASSRRWQSPMPISTWSMRSLCSPTSPPTGAAGCSSCIVC